MSYHPVEVKLAVPVCLGLVLTAFGQALRGLPDVFPGQRGIAAVLLLLVVELA
jgi:hypothetical protein